MSRRCSPLAPLLALFLVAGCQVVGFEDEATDDNADEATSDADSSDDTTSTTTTSGDTGPELNCDPGDDNSCPEGEKCTILELGGQLVYECVPDDGSKLPFEDCTVAPTTGQDECPAGHACVAIELGGTEGQCLELCINDADCEAALCTVPPAREVPVCGPICDPLGPLCPDAQACQRVRGSAFVCQFPGIDDHGITADGCDIANDRGCAEGFVCETGQIVIGCEEQSCCTALCDLSDADPCQSPMSCGELPLDPQPGLEDVGACYLPQ